DIRAFLTRSPRYGSDANRRPTAQEPRSFPRKRPHQDTRLAAERVLAGDWKINRVGNESCKKSRCTPCLRRISGNHIAVLQSPGLRLHVLAARPLRVREHWATELFGDYDPEAMLIRVWMRTACVRRSPLSARS